MSKLLSAAKILLGVLGAAAALFIVFVAWLILGTFGVVWSPFNCLTDIIEKMSGMSGHDFLISQTTCAGIGKGPAEISVFASEAKRRALIFKYERMHDGSRDAEPVVTPVDDRTVRISVKHVAMVICRAERWDTLAIEYGIGRVVEGDPSPRECVQD